MNPLRKPSRTSVKYHPELVSSGGTEKQNIVAIKRMESPYCKAVVPGPAPARGAMARRLIFYSPFACPPKPAQAGIKAKGESTTLPG